MAYFECSKYDRENYILDVRDHIDQKVIKNLMKRYGDGEYRYRNLGEDFEAVQTKTNRICNYAQNKRLV